VNMGTNIGSYGNRAYHAQVQLPKHTFTYEQYATNGYREHAAMNKQVASYNGLLHASASHLLKLNFIYSDLDYQTPGALTLPEYIANARASRPSTGTSQSAVMANAGIHQKAAVVALNNSYTFTKELQNTTSA